MNQTNLAVQTEAADSAFQFVMQGDGIGFIEINVPGDKQNTLKQEFGEQFDAVIEQVRSQKSLVGLVVVSTKPGSFLAGADINLFDQVQTAQEVTGLSLACQAAFQQLEDLPVPVVAAIDGPCLGGGMELALACNARVAADSSQTALGLPEVMLGLLPAAGGTQRLPRLIGIAKALDLLLTGRQLRPAQAKKMGLVDAVVPADVLRQAAVRKVRELSESSSPRGGLLDRLPKPSAIGDQLAVAGLEANPLGRKVLFQQARKQALAKTHGNYPAPEAILRAVEAGYAKGLSKGYAAEAHEFGLLAMTPQSRGLRSIFHATEALKKETFVGKGVSEREIQRVGVLGAGLMGAGIALVSVEKAQCDVRLKDRDGKGLAHGADYLGNFYRRRVDRKVLSQSTAERRIRRVTTTTDYSGFKSCELVVEAVFESVELKHQMLHDIEAAGNPNIIFASNTSSIPITKIAEVAQRPENVIGLHYFSPVEKMPLLEIITTEQTSPQVVASCVAFGKAQGKTVIVVKDGPGFYTTRVLAPYLNEAARMVSEGVPVEDVDKALLGFGFPIGPMTLMDEVGIDVGLKVGPILADAFGERMALPEASLKMQDRNWLGRKAGRGFYVYEGQKKGKRPVNGNLYAMMGVQPNKRLDATEMAERCVYMFANEAAYCLQEGVLQQPMHGDIGAVFGLGFMPFTGGPFRFMDQVGIPEVVAKLETFQAKYGARFAPAPILKDMAKARSKSKQRFYP